MRCQCTSKEQQNPDSKEVPTAPPVQAAKMDERKAEAARKENDIKNSTARRILIGKKSVSTS